MGKLMAIASFRSMSRAEHLQWCKDRALAYVDRGDLVNAMASFATDMRSHPETEESINSPGMAMLFTMDGARAVQDGDRHAMRRLIEGFH